MSYTSVDFTDDVCNTAIETNALTYTIAMPPDIDEWNHSACADAVMAALCQRQALAALLTEIREFWAGGDCPADLWARIVKATET